MKVTLLLADSAQAINGKLYMLGGGWTIAGPGPLTFAITGLIEVPWEEANREHRCRFELFDEDGHSILMPTPTGDQPFKLELGFEVGRPPGHKPGTPITVPLAFNLGPVPLPPGKRLIWKCSVNDESRDEWQLNFMTRPVPAGGQPGS